MHLASSENQLWVIQCRLNAFKMFNQAKDQCNYLDNRPSLRNPAVVKKRVSWFITSSRANFICLSDQKMVQRQLVKNQRLKSQLVNQSNVYIRCQLFKRLTREKANLSKDHMVKTLCNASLQPQGIENIATDRVVRLSYVQVYERPSLGLDGVQGGWAHLLKEITLQVQGSRWHRSL